MADPVTTVPGLDVSYWQSEVDWADVRASGQRFVFLKATEGLSYTDPTFVPNWQNARSAGLLRGAYGFYHPDQDARQQARRFIATIKSLRDEGELPYSIDLEATDGAPNRKIVEGTKAWLDEVEQAFGRRLMIYAGVSFLETNFIDHGSPPAWAMDYPLWLGWFPEQYIPGMSPLMPSGWSNWTFWQYSGKGMVNGISTDVDLDLFNGTIEQLQAFAGPQNPSPSHKTHVVAQGETIQTIAAQYSISVNELVTANPQLLHVGDVLTIPAPIGVPSPAPSLPPTYTVKAGDTLSAIAGRFGIPVSALVARNKITDPNLIRVGQILLIA